MNIPSLQNIYIFCKSHPEATASIIGNGLNALAVFGSVCIAAWLTYRFSCRHSKRSHNTAIKVARLQRDIDALEKIWELLAYMSINESEKTIIRWKRPKGGTSKDDEFFIHIHNMKTFIHQELIDIFYKQHAGLFLPKRIKEPLFEYRNILMKLYTKYNLAQVDNEQALLQLENPELVGKLRRSYEQLNKDLRDELKNRYKRLTDSA